tara:strand:+ start:456 stop:866 length:411 start_codon:yes stop_codon:yes gene_type:complete
LETIKQKTLIILVLLPCFLPSNIFGDEHDLFSNFKKWTNGTAGMNVLNTLCIEDYDSEKGQQFVFDYIDDIFKANLINKKQSKFLKDLFIFKELEMEESIELIKAKGCDSSESQDIYAIYENDWIESSKFLENFNN